MPVSDAAWTAIAYVVAAAIVGLPLLGAGLVVGRLTRRRVGWLGPPMSSMR